MENLRRLAEERLGKIELNSGLEYGTIAIQRYERSDGTNSWLVTIRVPMDSLTHHLAGRRTWN